MLSDARLYVISAEGPPEDQVSILCAAVDGGAGIVQLRNKTAPAAALVSAARRLTAYCRPRGVPVIVNDHLDVAIDAEADGVHLGQDDLDIVEARRRWQPGGLVGRSTHSLDQALAASAAGADYLGVGPVFATPTKPGRPAVGTELVAEVAAAGIEIPWFAIGGIDAGSIDTVLAAGARRVAVVRAVCAVADPAAAAAELKARLGAPVGGPA
ncbi:MAG: thiamine phosphate synthase [Candidatus Dormibacteraeota bacterium]|nr:thiamine phosphate synthase [Candidatus Dormibacteraeota bacterium]